MGLRRIFCFPLSSQKFIRKVTCRCSTLWSEPEIMPTFNIFGSHKPFSNAIRGIEPLSYRRVLVSTLLHDINYRGALLSTLLYSITYRGALLSTLLYAITYRVALLSTHLHSISYRGALLSTHLHAISYRGALVSTLLHAIITEEC
jgi:hypothetical protein